MLPLDYLKAYIAQHGGTAATAKRLGLPYSTLASFANGHRGVSPRMARRMADADPLLDANRLIWIRPTKRAA
jgi:plasmid maintenance system antidote protein VapI